MIERAFQSLFGLPLTPFELAEDFRWHGRPTTGDTLGAGKAPGVEVSDAFARLLEDGAEHLAAAKAASVEQSRAAAVQARRLAAFARQRPADLFDRPDDEVGAAAAASRASRPAALTGVSEWAVDEVVAALGLPSRTAGDLLAVSISLDDRFPATLDALAEGTITWAHARVMVDQVSGLSDDLRPGVEAALLRKAPGRTAAQLRAAARRAVLRVDASAAAKRLAQALRDRAVRMYGDNDGMASLTALMSAPVTRACYRRLEALAEACTTPDDTRTKDQRMTDCLADLLIGRGCAGPSPVQVQLTLVASAGTLLGGDEPGEVDGEPISALQVREMAYALGLLPRPTSDSVSAADGAPGAAADPEATAEGDDAAPADAAPAEAAPAEAAPAEAAPAAPSSAAAPPAAPPGADPRARAVADLAALLTVRTTTGTGLASLPTIAVVDEISGELRALTDGFEIRRIATCHRRACRNGHRPCTHAPAGSGLGPPPPTAGYTPSAALDRFVRARDRRCLFPGCRARPMRCDLDHVTPSPGGPTSAENLCCLCRHHHRLSHQAPGWTMRRLPNGGLEWTTPGGERLVTHPIPFGTDDLPHLPHPPPPTPSRVDDDPPPF